MRNLKMIDLYYYALELANANDNVIAEDFDWHSRKQALLFNDNDGYVASSDTSNRKVYTFLILKKNVIGKYQELIKFSFLPEFDSVHILFADALGNFDDKKEIKVSITHDFIDGPAATWHGGNHSLVLEVIRDFLTPWVVAKSAGNMADESTAQDTANPYSDTMRELRGLYNDMQERVDTMQRIRVAFCNDSVGEKFRDVLMAIHEKMKEDTAKLESILNE